MSSDVDRTVTNVATPQMTTVNNHGVSYYVGLYRIGHVAVRSAEN